MEHVFWRPRVRIDMRLFLVLLLFVPALPICGQSPQDFYNVDAELKVSGDIEEIFMESRYAGTAPFLIVTVKDEQTGRKYVIEIGPAWFFEYDVHKGENIAVVGSLRQPRGELPLLIARKVILRGETRIMRDKYGFPSWRGGRGRGRGWRRGRRG